MSSDPASGTTNGQAPQNDTPAERSSIQTMRQRFNSLRPNRGLSLSNSAFAPPSNLPSNSWSSSGSNRTLRAIRPAADDSYDFSTDKSTDRDGSPSRSLGLPNHLNRNMTALNGSGKGEVSVVRVTKEEEEEDRKLREKEATLSWDQKQAMSEKATKVREEIMQTERNYVDCITLLYNAFVAPLTKSSLEDLGIQESHRAALVSNLQLLYNFHNQFIEDLDKGKPERVEFAFIKYSPFFRMYTTYLNDYQKMFDTFQALRNTKKFQQFLTNVRADIARGSGSGGKLDLMSYLIMPVQRVPRYVLLLKELKKNTLPSLPAFESINNALSQITRTASHINESKRQIENMNTLFEIQHRINGDIKDFSLIQPYRRFIREEELLVFDPSKKSLFGTLKQVPRVFFLFNDILLWTNKDMAFKAYINLPAARVTTINPDDPFYDPEMAPKMFCITSSDKHLVITCPDAATCSSWTEEINYQLCEQQEARRQRRNVKSFQSGAGKTSTHSLIVGNLEELRKRRDGEEEMSVSRAEPSTYRSRTGTLRGGTMRNI